MRRRELLGFLAMAMAAPRAAMAGALAIPLDKAFPYLVGYLQMPAADRSHFYLAFQAYRDKHVVADVAAVIVAANGARTPIAFDRRGIVTRLPDLATLKSGGHVEIASAPFQMAPELRCALPPSLRIDVSQLTIALAQVNSAVVKFAGALSLVLPKFTTAFFPDAGPAQVVMGDGRTATLPSLSVPQIGPVSYIEPASLAGARTVILAKAPSQILLSPRPKKT